eukprot:SAG22_NODE_537_length_9361_cov_53.700821_9_plen_71_part_00
MPCCWGGVGGGCSRLHGSLTIPSFFFLARAALMSSSSSAAPAWLWALAWLSRVCGLQNICQIDSTSAIKP